MSENKVKKLDKLKDGALIKLENEKILQMKDDMNKESEVRNLMLNRN